jgi:hypothetical protein
MADQTREQILQAAAHPDVTEAAMVRITTSLIGLILLTACSSFPRDDSHAYRPGIGVVEAVRAVDEIAPPPNRTSGTIQGSPAANGGSNSADSSAEGYQLMIRMDDGRVQTLTQDNPDFQVGDRVQVTSDGRVVRHSG